MKFQLSTFNFPNPPAPAAAGFFSRLKSAAAFSLVEVLLVITLLSLIVLALMNVFNATQSAFRASVTQTDVLEGGRAAMEMIATDLRGMTPSGGVSNANIASTTVLNNSMNFFSLANNYGYAPLLQSLTASSFTRTNLLNYFFVLGRNNNKWTGVGYIVDTTSQTPLYPLYRFYADTNIANSPRGLFNQFANAIQYAQWTNMSHIMDGVVHLVVRARDTHGSWVNNYSTNVQNVFYLSTASTPVGPYGWGEGQFYMFSNTVPAAVELQLGILEDRPLQRAESLPFNSYAQSNYLSLQAEHVHVFRQLVTIPNVDPSAYQ